MYDAGTPLKDADKSAAASQTGEAFWPRFRQNARFSAKLYTSASRVALGNGRWVAAAGVMGALSLSLLAAGLYAVTASYQSVETASLTAESAPQILASDMPRPDGAQAVSVAAAPTRAAPVAHIAMAAPEAPHDDQIALSDLRSTQDAQAEPVATVPAEPQIMHTTIELGSGETLMEVLTNAGADRVDAYHAVAAMKDHYSPTKLRAGQSIDLTFLKAPAGANEPGPSEDTSGSDADATATAPAMLLTAISLQPDIERSINVSRSDDGGYTSQEIQKELTQAYARGKGTIKSSLFLDAEQAGVPAQIIVQMIRMFSYSVDFQREIHPGDQFEVYFDRKLDEDGVAVKEGEIAYASLSVSGKQYRLWRFEMPDGSVDYYDDKGNSMKKFLMRTPIDGARISSGFGMRTHPVLGYSKMHAGVDFAAPKGTPIYAAGNGKIEIAGWVNGYGNFVKIRHSNNYETGYGHMSAFARGIKPGTRVKQGEVIGYVGSTGRSTGPHLHYEIVIAGKKMNPLSVKMATNVKLDKKQLASFQKQRASVDKQMAQTPTLTQVAQASTSGKTTNVTAN